MAETSREKLFKQFRALTDGTGRNSGAIAGALYDGPDASSALEEANRQISLLANGIASTGTPAERDQAVTSASGVSSRSRLQQTSSGSSGLMSALASGLGVVPLLAGLLGLFGSKDDAEPELAKYSFAQSLAFEGATLGKDIAGIDYGQTGAARLFRSETGPQGPVRGQGGTNAPSSGESAPQITVNVQAMDSRSFLDHSGEIAQAVREAMLNLSSINDVVNEL